MRSVWPSPTSSTSAGTARSKKLGLTDADAYSDYRSVLERDDVDAIFIGAVDHWHSTIATEAMDAGKHVYCEKPMTRYLHEAFDIYDKTMETGMIFQIGSQYCTEGKWHRAAEMIQAGMIGPLVLGQDSYCRNNPDGEWNYSIDENSSPENIDWATWLGPVSDRPFSADEYHRWRKYYPYCAGILGDLLAHRIHPLMLATGAPEFPVRVASLGTRKITTDRDVPDNTQVLAEFPSGLTIMVIGSTVNEQGLEQVIRGHEGTLYFGGNTVELRPERPFADLVDQQMEDNIEPGVSVPAHVENWLTSIRGEQATQRQHRPGNQGANDYLPGRDVEPPGRNALLRRGNAQDDHRRRTRDRTDHVRYARTVVAAKRRRRGWVRFDWRAWRWPVASSSSSKARTSRGYGPPARKRSGKSNDWKHGFPDSFPPLTCPGSMHTLRRKPCRSSPWLFDLLKHSLYLHRCTDGAFDLTVGPLMQAWGFYGDGGRVPDADELAEARLRTGMHLVELDEAHRTVRFAHEGVALDFGAIGKGYAVTKLCTC